MALLNANFHAELTEYVIRLLNKNQILTDLDFVRGDTRKLAKLTNLDFTVVLKMQQAVMDAHKPLMLDGATIYKNVLQRMHTMYMATGIESLDELLAGGLMIGKMYEICGASSAGKTQLCKTIAVNLALNHKIGTLFVDCKGALSGKRFQQMLSARQKSSEEIESTLSLIRVQRIGAVTQFVEMLQALLDSTELSAFLGTHRLLVVNSMPALWYLCLGDKTSKGKRYLAIATGLLRRLMVQHNMAIVVVNLATKFVSSTDCTPTSTSDEQMPCSSSTRSQPRGVEMTTPGLGKYWRSVPSVRLGMAKVREAAAYEPISSVQSDGNSLNSSSLNAAQTSMRNINVLRSIMGRTRMGCTVTITDAGVV